MSQLFQSTFHTLTMDEAKIEIEDNPNIIIVDVRTPEEYQKGHIPGAINVPVETPQLITEKIPDKNETIFVYCLSGGRAKEHVNYLPIWDMDILQTLRHSLLAGKSGKGGVGQ